MCCTFQRDNQTEKTAPGKDHGMTRKRGKMPLPRLDFFAGEEEPGFEYRVGIERQAVDALVEEPAGEIGMI